MSKPRGLRSQRLVLAVADQDIPVVTPGEDHSYNMADFHFVKAVWNSEYGIWEEYHPSMPIDPETQTIHDVLVIE